MTLHAYLLVALALFCIGLYGLLQRRSLIAMLIALELMLAAVSLNVVAITSLRGAGSSVGQVVALILIGVAAAEGAIALSLFVAIQREVRSINVEDLSGLKG
ncbi:MAG: NADH-quinone oxidoreductase subunit K [Gemmatimonadetes bacterium 21-71-4]|nr:MAG: NADH-quinone oxidoreductase subunit K [Gemmatimonadetes bacterium 21-71-4]